MNVSVLMPVFNNESTVKEAIHSILNQTMSEFELIVVDDRSTDRSVEAVSSIRDGRLRLLRNPGKGLAVALNHGLREARGDFIVRMDADDRSVPSRLERQIGFLMNNPSINLCGTHVRTFGAVEGELLMPENHPEIAATLLFGTPFVHPTVAFTRAVPDEGFFYNEDFELAQDYELWARVVPRFRCANLPEFLVEMRRRGEHQEGSKYRERQKGYANKARSVLLDGLGIRLSDEELHAYRKVASKEFNLSDTEQRVAMGWSLRIIEELKGRYSTERALREVVSNRLFWALSESVSRKTAIAAVRGIAVMGGEYNVRFAKRAARLVANAFTS